MSARRRFVKPILIVLAVLLAGSALVHWAALAFSRAMMSADPYPAFMAEYDAGRSRSYEDAKRAFSDFVTKTFPVGSDAGNAIAQIIEGGFQAEIQASESSRFTWKRHSGPCSEWYTIGVKEDAGRRIAGITGRLQPVCL